jgi:hypothetical protein
MLVFVIGKSHREGSSVETNILSTVIYIDTVEMVETLRNRELKETGSVSVQGGPADPMSEISDFSHNRL